MAETIYTGTVKKRVNSTLQPTLSTSYNVLLKNGCSIDNPVFYLSASGFSDNYIKWNDRYYYVTDITYETNTRTAVSCALDVLATYKSDILASTQFVSYSSQSGGTWLADNRIPLKKSATVLSNASVMGFLFSFGGFYVLTAVGQNGCKTYGLDETMVNALLNDVSTWTTTMKNNAKNDISFPTATDVMEACKNICDSLAHIGTLGNSYTDAPNCIRSCIWVPFLPTNFVSGSGGATIHLGEYDTGVAAIPCKTTPYHDSISISIPWQHSDWRRSVCEEIYIYLPLVGLVNVSTDEIINESTITIEFSATASDGCIAYLLKAGSQVIGTYGANCAVQVPLGISQYASAGEILQSILGAAPKVVAGSIVGAPAAGALMGVYDVLNTAATKHNSCIGGIGGGAGVGLSLSATIYSVSHDTIVTPASMQSTMGLPTMQPMSLSSLTGFCQCANAHVATDAEYSTLERIDAFLNTGFYIE